MSTHEASVLLGAIQHRIVAVVDDLKNAIDDQPPDATRQNLLITALNDPKVLLPDIKHLNLSELLDRLGLDGLFNNLGGLIQRGQGATASPILSLPLFEQLGQLGLRNRLNPSNLPDLFQKLLSGNLLDTLRDEIKSQVNSLRPAGAAPLPDVIHGILGRQASIGISFLTSLKNLANHDLPEQVVKGWMQYFFASGGYHTLDGVQVVAPGQATQGVPDLAALPQRLKGLLNERSAEQYVRDLIRILVEVADNLRYGLEDRLPKLKAKVKPEAQDKAVKWFTGAGSMAESLVTSAVEELSLGVAQFQTNPVIAAAAATYAGTAARKAGQHLFLAEAGV